MGFEVAFNKAVYDKLKNDEAVSALVRGVYDDVNQITRKTNNNDYPYIVIADTTWQQDDTNTENGCIGTLTIHVWGNKRGQQETAEIKDAIYDALHLADDLDLSPSGFEVIYMHYESTPATQVVQDTSVRFAQIIFSTMIQEG
jgi:hypothetical protein